MPRLMEAWVELGVRDSLSRAFDSAQQRVSRGTSEIVEKFKQIERAANFQVKLQNITNVSGADKALDGMMDQVIQLKLQMKALFEEKRKLLSGAGYGEATSQRFSTMAGMPPTLGSTDLKVVAAANAIDERRTVIIREMAEALNLRAMAQSRLNTLAPAAEAAERKAAFVEQAHQMEASREAQLATSSQRQQQIGFDYVAEQERFNSVQQQGAQITNELMTAQERQAGYLKRVAAAYQQGAISAQTYARAQKFGGNIQNFEGQVKGANRLHFALLQASYGVQDFMVMYGPMGLGGALRASVNNWAMVASAMGPVVGAVGGLAITLGSVLITNLIESGKESDKTAKKVSTLADAIRRANAEASRRMGIFSAENVDSISGTKEGFSEIQSSEKQIAEADEAVRLKREKLRNLERGKLPTVTTGRVAPGGGGTNPIDDLFQTLSGQEMTVTEKAKLTAQFISGEDFPRIKAAGGMFEYTPETGVGKFTRPREADRLKEIEEDIKTTTAEINEEEAKKQAANARILATKDKLKDLGDEELATIKRQLSATDELSKKLFQIEENRRKARADAVSAMDAAGVGIVDRGGVLTGIDAEAKREGDKARREDAEQRRRSASGFYRGIRDDMDRGFAPFGRIFDELEERTAGINELFADKKITEEERDRRLALSKGVVDVQLEEIRRKSRQPASFSDAVSFGQEFQLSMMSNAQDQAVRDTAKYAKLTVDQLIALNAKKTEPAVTD